MSIICTLIFYNLSNSDNIPNMIWSCQQHRPLGYSVIIPDAAFSRTDMCNGTILFLVLGAFFGHSQDILVCTNMVRVRWLTVRNRKAVCINQRVHSYIIFILISPLTILVGAFSDYRLKKKNVMHVNIVIDYFHLITVSACRIYNSIVQMIVTVFIDLQNDH